MSSGSLSALSSLFTALLALPLSAQTQDIRWLNDNSPTLGSGNAFPWGSEGIRYQVIVPGNLLGGPAVLRDLLVAGDPNTARPSPVTIGYGDIEIRMGLTQESAPVNDWNRNNPNPTTVFRGPLRVTFERGAWRAIGMPQWYLWLPLSPLDNLCIEVIVWSVVDRGGLSATGHFYFPLTGTAASPGGAIPRAFLSGWTTSMGNPNTGTGAGGKLGILLNDGNMVAIGDGCTSSANTVLRIGNPPNTWPRQASVFTVNLTGALPTSAALFTLGRSESVWSGIPLPLDLTPVGAPGCWVWNDILLQFGTAADASGNASFPLPIPPATAGVVARASWLNLDPAANSLGLTTSNFARLLVGN